MAPKIPLCCWAVLPLLFTSCGESAEAAPTEPPAVKAPLTAEQKRAAELSRRVSETRERMRELRREKISIDEQVELLMPADLQSEQAKAWRERASDLRLRIVRERADLNNMLDEIAELSRAY